MKILIATLCLHIFFVHELLGQELIDVQGETLDFEVDWTTDPQYSIDTSVVDSVQVISEYWDVDVSDEEHPNWKYSLSKDEYTSAYIHSDSTLTLNEQIINSTQNSLLDDDNYELVSSIEIEKNGYFGKEFKWKNKIDNDYFRHDVYIIENWIVQLSVFSRTGQEYNKSIEEFFDSFRLNSNLKGNYALESPAYEQSYSIDFPESPIYSTKTIDSELGKLILHLKLCEPKHDENNGLYMSNETIYPVNTVDESNVYDLNNFYINSINGSLNAVNGQLISIRNLVIENSTGKEFKCYISNGTLILTYRIVLKNGILYNLGVMCAAEKDGNEAMIQFLNSFKIDL